MTISLDKKEAGFTLIEIIVGLGITAVVALGGAYFISDIQSFFTFSKNESQLTDARTLIPIIFDSEKICSENLKGIKQGEVLKGLTINKTKVFEMNKTLDLTASREFSDKYSMNKVTVENFIPFGAPFIIEFEGEEKKTTQGFMNLGIHYSRYMKGMQNNLKNFAENYLVLVLLDDESKVLGCLSSFLSSPNDFCTNGLRGVIDPEKGTCHNLKLSTHDKNEPAITLDNYLSSGEKKSLKMFEDGMLIGDFPNVISIGGKLSRYTEIVKFVADKESYNPDGSVKETLERNQVYYRASYKANPIGMYPPYTYKVEEKRNFIKKPNSDHKVEEWKPAEVKFHLKESFGDAKAWEWEKWSKAEMNDYDEKNWFFSVYGKTPFYTNPSFNMNPHPLKDGVPSKKVVEQLFNSEGGVILANSLKSRLKQDDEEINSFQTFESGYYAYFSDKGLKENIHSITSPEEMKKLNGVKYYFNENEDQRDFGFIAQDVSEHFPSAVSVGSDGYKSVDYYSLLSPLLEMIKKQDAKISLLKQQVKELE